MKEITVVAQNRIGMLASIAEALGARGVNIEAISAYATDNKAIFRIITTDPDSAKHALKDLQVDVFDSDVVIVDLINRPGELGKITRKLANAMIDLESVYIISKEKNYTTVAIKPAGKNAQKIKDVLHIR